MRPDDLLQDLRYASRTLRHHRAFSVAAVLTLALGIGATTAIFSVVSGVVLRPLPFADPARLVQIFGTPASRGEAVDNLDVYRRESTSFEAIAGYSVSARFLVGPNGPERVMTVAADRDLFAVLGVDPLAGRTFEPSDPPEVAVVSELFWREHLGVERSAVGMTVMLDRVPFTIVGIMPASFQFPYNVARGRTGAAADVRTDAWIPSVPPPAPIVRTDSVAARLKPGVSLAAASAELDVIAARIQAERPDPNGARGVRIVPLSDSIVTAAVRRPLFLLLGAVALVLALACANVTNLSLVRTTLRQRELAIRTAIGASPRRLVRQLLTESLMLSLAGGMTGLVLAQWGTQALTDIARRTIPRAGDVSVDWRVFLFSLAVSGVTALVVGLAPALVAMRAKGQSALQESGGRVTMGRGSRAVRNALVVAEVALAFVLACGAGLLLRELVRLQHVDTGMDTSNILTFHLGERPTWWGVNRSGPPPAEDVRPLYDIARQVRAMPGVRAAGFTQMLPLQNWGWTANVANLADAGASGNPARAQMQAELRYVTPGYFEAFGIPVRRGRAIDERDNADAPPVIVINDTLARRLFDAGDPIGRVTPRGTIVGVAGDVRQVNLDRAASPEIYYPIAQNYSELVDLGMTLVVKTEDRPDGLIAPIRDTIRRISPSQAVFNVRTMDQVISDSLAEFTLYLWLMSAFAVLSLALAAIGTYGVMAYISASRMREFAVRVALGATRGALTGLVFRDGARLMAAGLLFGLVASLIAAPYLQSLPVTIRPPSVTTLAWVALLVAASAMIACLVPALRAAGADPMRALREE